jgi:histidinol-phosphatase (PHP family)
VIDNHIHTKLCKHAEGELFDYIEKAINLGIEEIAFTDHIPLPGNFDSVHRMKLNDIDIYTRWVMRAKANYPEITIRYGIEADFYEGFEDFTEKFLNQYDFDLVIMSVHFIRHWSKGNWVFDYHFPDKSKEEIFKDYLSTIVKGVKTGLFDVLGHPDIIKSPGDSLLQIIPNEVIQLLKIVKKSGMAVELNTSGYRKNVGEPYPGLDWLPVLRDYAVPLTTGSDAHHPSQVGLRFNSLYHKIKEQDIGYLVVYDKRRQIEQKIK